VQLSFIAVTWW